MSASNDRTSPVISLFCSEKRLAVARTRGFTLIELIIVAILLMVAAPNYAAIISGSKVDGARLGLATSLALARTEAIKRGETIRLCAGIAGDRSSTDWNQGWQVVHRDSADVAVSYDCGSFIVYRNSGARGSSSGGCAFSLSSGASTRSLTINPAGRVRMN